jgi:hypothetical protein
MIGPNDDVEPFVPAPVSDGVGVLPPPPAAPMITEMVFPGITG